MAKILFFVLIILAVYLVFRARRGARAPRSGTPPSADDAQDIVACARCGVHVPVGDSVEVDGKRYCCAEHGRLG